MKLLLIVVLPLFFFPFSAEATEITAPIVPESGVEIMPEAGSDFTDSLIQLIENGVFRLQPELREAVRLCMQILVTALLFSILPGMSNRIGKVAPVVSATAISVMVFQHADTLIRLASETVQEICEYGKLLCPVMTTALAAQGGVSSSTALYMGTSVFTALLSTLISVYFIPLVYAFLAFAAANSALGEEYLRKFADSIKNVLTWLLKTLLIIFTTYMSITGVVAGTTDAAALKAAKVTVSTAVPVVGGILSDASEAVLISIGLMKNAAGIYGIVAALAVFLGPFLKVGVQYLAFKLSAALCSTFASKNIATLINDLSTAFGLLLAMLAAACTMVLISTVSFLKGVG